MGGHPPYGQVPGGVPGPGGAAFDGRLTQRKTDGKWEYTLEATAREESGFQTIEEYIQRRHNMVVQYIATQSLTDLCKGIERSPGERVVVQW